MASKAREIQKAVRDTKKTNGQHDPQDGDQGQGHPPVGAEPEAGLPGGQHGYRVPPGGCRDSELPREAAELMASKAREVQRAVRRAKAEDREGLGEAAYAALWDRRVRNSSAFVRRSS
jgi:hypothetical protein